MQNLKRLAVITSLGAAVAVLGLSGCESWGHRSSDERTAGRVVDDAHITHTVQSGLRNEPVYKFSDVDVKTYGGVVQLNGFVNTEEQKRRAAEIAQQTPGVNQVLNNLTLKTTAVPTPTGRPAPNQP